MTMRRALLASVLLALAAMWGLSALDFMSLPERFPSHFDAAGVPDHYAEKSSGSWFALPMIFTLLSAFFGAIAIYLPGLAATHAQYVNVPDKEAFLALPAERRARALEPMRDLMLMMILPFPLLSLYITHGSFRIATGHTNILSPWPVILVIAFSFVSLSVAVVRTKSAIALEGAAKT